MSLEDEMAEALRRYGSMCIEDIVSSIQSKKGDDNIELDKLEWDLGVIYEKRVDKFGNPTYNKRDLSHVNQILDAIASKNKEKIMDIKDIKAGYLVQFMSGELAIAIPHSSGDMIFIRDDGFCVSGTQDYENIWDDDNNPRYAIDSVYGLSDSCQGVFPLNTNKRELIWKRRQAIQCSKCPYYLNGGEF